VDIESLHAVTRSDPDRLFSYPPDPYETEDDSICDFPEEAEIIKEFKKTGARIYESRLSPFHTGSISVRGVKTLLYAPKGSMPREIGGPLRELPLRVEDSDGPELRLHKIIYEESHFQTIIHCYVPEAEALSHYIPQGESTPPEKIIPIDAEGSFLYLVVPVVPPKTGTSTLIRLLHDYKVVIVRGGGVWGVGSQSLSEVLHHPSSVREICFYRLGAIERGLDLKKLEPKKATRW
jgi:hypothetical protein